jgi:hypothetical protein
MSSDSTGESVGTGASPNKESESKSESLFQAFTPAYNEKTTAIVTNGLFIVEGVGSKGAGETASHADCWLTMSGTPLRAAKPCPKVLTAEIWFTSTKFHEKFAE